MLGGCRLLRVGSGAAEDPHQSFRLIWLSKREGLCWCACGWHAINLQHVATIISLRFYPARGTRAWEQLCGINGVEGDGVPSTQVRTYVLHFMLLTVVRVHSGSTLLHVLYCTCLVGLAKPTCACAGQREAVKNLLCARVAAENDGNDGMRLVFVEEGKTGVYGRQRMTPKAFKRHMRATEGVAASEQILENFEYGHVHLVPVSCLHASTNFLCAGDEFDHHGGRLVDHHVCLQDDNQNRP